MTDTNDFDCSEEWLQAELDETFDEDFELEISEPALSLELRRIYKEKHTKAKEDTLARTNIPEAPWFIVEANDKKRARLNCIHHLLEQIPYGDVPDDNISLPDRVFNANYERRVLPTELYVPKRY